MTERNPPLGILFARLAHPEGIVRERSCWAIARLLNSSSTTEPTREALTTWMNQQRLESIAIFALLIWIRARAENAGIELPNPETIGSSFPRHSLVSWLLLQDVYGPDCPEPDWKCTFSEGLRRDFTPDPFFLKHAIHFVPPVYAENANQIAREKGIPFVSQWAWEWSGLVQDLSIIPDGHVLRSRGDADSDLHVCYDFRLSEIYRSAYLRTLSWAMHHRFLDREEALMHAVGCCPIDVGLWGIPPGHLPAWWPTVSEPGDTIDETVGRVMERLKTLFHEQTLSEDGCSLVEASGLIQGKNVHVELEIYGVFQKCLGPREPEIAEVVQDFRWNIARPLAFDSWTRFSGHLIPWPQSSYVDNKEHWEIVPAFTRIESPVVSRWQWWRHYRQVWSPALCLVDGPLDISVTEDGVLYDYKSSQVGRWTDWSSGLRYTRDANLPPATGQALYVRRELLEAFARANNYSFCWMWRIIGYHRTGSWGKYDTVSFEGELGATRICVE